MKGGQNAGANDAPGMLGLNIRLPKGNSNYGGATLVSRGGDGAGARALTAAHCLKYDLNEVVVRSGSLRWDRDGTPVKVKEYYVHPSYALPHGIDLAVLVLDRALPEEGIAELADADDKPYEAKSPVTMAGWGPPQINGLNPDQLQKITLELVDPGGCGTEGRDSNADFACCRPANQTGTTPGDSGGPMYKDGKLFGVIEGGQGGASIATRVDKQRAWIDNPREARSYVVPPEPTAIVVAANGRRYITHGSSNSVTVLDANWDRIATIEVSGTPQAIVAAPGGTRLYVASSTAIQLIDSVANTVGDVAGVGAGLSGLAVVAGGTKLFVVNGETVKFFTIAADGKLTATGNPVQLDRNPAALGVAPDGQKVYLVHRTETEIEIVDVAAQKKINSFEAGDYGNSSVVATDQHLYVGSQNREIFIVRRSDGGLIKTMEVAADRAVKSLALAGTDLYAGYETTNDLAQIGVEIIDTTNLGNARRTLQLGGAPLASLVPTPTGGILAVNHDVASVSVLR